MDSALKRFKNQLIKLGVFREMKARAYYLRPSERRRRKSNVARAKLKKHERQMAEANERLAERIEYRKQFGRRIYVALRREVTTT